VGILERLGGLRAAMISRATAITVVTSIALLPNAAQAAIVEQLSSTTSWNLSILSNGGGGAGGIQGDADSGTFHTERGPDTTGFVSGDNVGSSSTDFVSRYSGAGSFDYLHNVYCYGTCTASVYTIITDVITNNGPDAVEARFDTQITAGHIAYQGIDTNPRSVSSFSFTIMVEGLNYQSYGAFGSAAATGASIETVQKICGEGGACDISSTLNGATAFDDVNQHAIDWSATNVSVALGLLAPGQSKTVSLYSFTLATSAAVCADLTIPCDGTQVVFGDPRNSGDGSSNRSAFRGSGPDPEPLIGRQFTASSVFVQAVDAVTTALPEEPELNNPPVDYQPAPNFNAAVPEPATWATFLLGFGALGLAVRRRQRLPA
jgi:hypothetical protein